MNPFTRKQLCVILVQILIMKFVFVLNKDLPRFCLTNLFKWGTVVGEFL